MPREGPPGRRGGRISSPPAGGPLAGSLGPAIVLLGCLALLAGACSGRGAEETAGELPVDGSAVEEELSGGQVHRWRVALEEGDFVHLQVEQLGADVRVALEAPGGEEIVEADRPTNDLGPEDLLAVAAGGGDHRLSVHGYEGMAPGRYRALLVARRTATERDRRKAGAFADLASAASLGGEQDEEAAGLWRRAQATFHELGEDALEADAALRLGGHYHGRGEWRPATESYRLAADASRRAGSALWEGVARANLAAGLIPLGEAEEAVDQATIAVDLARGEGDRWTAAQALHMLASAQYDLGELQLALDHYQQALDLWSEDASLRPYTLHDLGVLYARRFGQPETGRALLEQARDAWRPGWEANKAATLSQLGHLDYDAGRLAAARGSFETALDLRGNGESCGSAVLHARLGLVAAGEGRPPEADRELAQALSTVGARSCPASEITVLLLAAALAERRHDHAARVDLYRRSLDLAAATGDRIAEAQSLAWIARAERARGRPQAALEASRRALAIVEGVRPTVLREDLRTSYFAGVQPMFGFHVDLLSEQGDDQAAWRVAERARAQALQDLLIEAAASGRGAANPELATRERTLHRRLNALESRRRKTSERKPEELEELRRRIDGVVAELQTARGEMRRGEAATGELRPGARALAELQGLLEPGTLLLEYRLGAEASHLWAVDRESLTAYRLPPRDEIEIAAREAAQAIRHSLERRGRKPKPVCDLARAVLEPVADRLAGRRLIVVPDGALESVAFAALPDPASGEPCAEAPPLVAGHEISYLPSAATAVTLRRRLEDRRPGSGWLAVVADPTYGPDLRPLEHARAEAEAILAGRPSERTFRAYGAEATKQTVLDGALADFRILHFATHGVLDPEHPLLSHLALASRDAAGRPLEGDLYAHEIYRLELPAELVVLSACDTALGRDVPGEGMVAGLPRAFLYAGAARVLVSLWAVGGEGTSELMTRFYGGLLDRGLPPAKALQEAQRAMWRAGEPPYRWAGFVLQGDPRPLPPFPG